jgi:hypothetical protein
MRRKVRSVLCYRAAVPRLAPNQPAHRPLLITHPNKPDCSVIGGGAELACLAPTVVFCIIQGAFALIFLKQFIIHPTNLSHRTCNSEIMDRILFDKHLDRCVFVPEAATGLEIYLFKVGVSQALKDINFALLTAISRIPKNTK